MKLIISILFLASLTSKILAHSIPSKLSGIELFSGSKQEFEFADHKKWSVVFFLQTSCPCSHSHLAHLAELAKSYPEVNFLGVHTDGYTNSKDAKDYFAPMNLPFQIVADEDFSWSEKFEAMKTPETYLISPKGEVKYTGAVSDSSNFEDAKKFYLKELLDIVKKKKELPYSHKKALGCYITRERKES